MIVSSASVSLQEQKKTVERGGTAFLSKPLNASQLLELLQTHLNLTWIYDEPSGTPAPETIIPEAPVVPPRELLEQLLDHARIGDVKTLRDVIQDLNQPGDPYAAFWPPILTLAKQFRSEEIEVLLEQYLEAEHPTAPSAG